MPEGLLSPLEPATVASTSPSWLVVSPDNQNVYALDNAFVPAIAQFKRDTSTGKLTPLEPATVSPGGSGSEAFEIVISADGKNVYAAMHSTKVIAQFSRNAETGKLTPLEPATVETVGKPNGLDVAPDGKHVYVGVSGGELRIYQRNAETGALSFFETISPGFTPVFITISPDSKNLYFVMSGEVPDKIQQYSRDKETGKLTKIGSIVAEDITRRPALSPDGKSVYVVNSYSGTSTVSQYARNGAGELTALEPASVVAPTEPYDIVISPDGENAYVTSRKEKEVAQYKRDPATGKLTALGTPTVAAGGEPFGIAASPDGKSVYSANHEGNTIAQFARSTGVEHSHTLTAAQAQTAVLAAHMPAHRLTIAQAQAISLTGPRSGLLSMVV